MVLISKNFLIENLSVRFAIPVSSVIFKNSAAVTNRLPDGQQSNTATLQKHCIVQTSELPSSTMLMGLVGNRTCLMFKNDPLSISD